MTEDTSLPVNQEPLHQMVLKNDYVEVMHVTIPPGQSTMQHTHSHDGVAVRLSEATVRAEVPGEAAKEALVVRAGDVSAPAYAKRHFTHRVSNVGQTTFEVIDVEFLKRPEGPTTEPIATPAAENACARAYQWALSPGASTPEHTHERPYLLIAATPMQLVMKAPDGSSMEHSVKAGDFHWVDSRVTHVLTNHGNQAGVMIEVELK